MSNVRVAVRVRPLSGKEKDKGAHQIVTCSGDNLSITNVKLEGISEYADSRERTKHFTFDYCYDSTGKPQDQGFASQEVVYQDLGTEVLQAAIEGYNACLFAYGQTSTGKTYTMMGMTGEVGVIPRIGEGLFSHIGDDQDTNKTLKVDVSYLEIYNERVRDLLHQAEHGPSERYTLKVREHPKEGPYVQELTKHYAKDFEDFQTLLDKGNESRTTAATHMHEHSSRSHAIFTIVFTQAMMEDGIPHEIVSKIHLVDLAGSERADPSYHSEYKGRLKEGANINKSLVTLGNVIKALAEKSLLSWSMDNMGSTQSFHSGGGESLWSPSNSPRRHRSLYIPYRDSVLTWLLKDSLGGNSKTIMIATISPASIYYNESISTLRYAQRAKCIINKPKVNEDPNVAIIRELRREIFNLKNLLESTHGHGTEVYDTIYYVPDICQYVPCKASNEQGDPDSTISKILEKDQSMVLQLTKEWNDKWSVAHSIMKDSEMSIQGLGRRSSSHGILIDLQLPYFIAMDEDVLSTGIEIFNLKEGITRMGCESPHHRNPDIVLSGISIKPDHCAVKNQRGEVTLYPHTGAVVTINGQDITEPTVLTQGDAVFLGKTHRFRYKNPAEAARLRDHRRSLQDGSLALGTSMRSLQEFEPTPAHHSTMPVMFNPKLDSAETCVELERKYKTEQEKVEQAQLELERVTAQLSKVKETKEEIEECMWKSHNDKMSALEEEKRHLVEMIERTQVERDVALDELKEARIKLLQEDKEAREQLQHELQKVLKLKEKQDGGRSAETVGIQTDSSASDSSDEIPIGGATGREIKLHKTSVEGRLKHVLVKEIQSQALHKKKIKELEDQEKEVEEQYIESQEEFAKTEQVIHNDVKQVRQEDISHYHDISTKAEEVERLEKKGEQLQAYIEEKRDLQKVESDTPKLKRIACSLEKLSEKEREQYIPRTRSLLSVHDKSAAIIRDGLSEESNSCRSSSLSLSYSADCFGGMPRSSYRKTKHKPLSQKALSITERLYRASPPRYDYLKKNTTSLSSSPFQSPHRTVSESTEKMSVPKFDYLRKGAKTNSQPSTSQSHLSRRVKRPRAGMPPKQSFLKKGKGHMSSSYPSLLRGQCHSDRSKDREIHADATKSLDRFKRADEESFEKNRPEESSHSLLHHDETTSPKPKRYRPLSRSASRASSLASVPEAVAEEEVAESNLHSVPNVAIDTSSVIRRKKRHHDPSWERPTSMPVGDEMRYALAEFGNSIQNTSREGVHYVECLSGRLVWTSSQEELHFSQIENNSSVNVSQGKNLSDISGTDATIVHGPGSMISSIDSMLENTVEETADEIPFTDCREETTAVRNKCVTPKKHLTNSDGSDKPPLMEGRCDSSLDVICKQDISEEGPASANTKRSALQFSLDKQPIRDKKTHDDIPIEIFLQLTGKYSAGEVQSPHCPEDKISVRPSNDNTEKNWSEIADTNGNVLHQTSIAHPLDADGNEQWNLRTTINEDLNTSEQNSSFSGDSLDGASQCDQTKNKEGESVVSSRHDMGNHTNYQKTGCTMCPLVKVEGEVKHSQFCGEVSHTPEDSQKQNQVLEDALQQLGSSRTMTGTFHMSGRRNKRQRPRQKDAESDSQDHFSDDSLAGSGNHSRQSSRPGSGSRRRKRPVPKSLENALKKRRDHTSDEYLTSDNDSIYSDDSLTHFDNKHNAEHGQNKGVIDEFSVISQSVQQLTADMDTLDNLEESEDHGVTLDVGTVIQNFIQPQIDLHPFQGLTESHLETLIPDESYGNMSSDFTQTEGGSVQMRMSPVNVWSSEEGESFLPVQKEKVTVETKNQQLNGSCIAFKRQQKLSVSPTEVWTNTPEVSHERGHKDTYNDGESRAKKKKNSSDTLAESNIGKSRERNSHPTIRYEVIINEDNTDIMYNVEKTEYRTYALKSVCSDGQHANTISAIPESFNINLTETKTFQQEDRFESVTKEKVLLQKDDSIQDADDMGIITSERMYESNHSLECEEVVKGFDVSRGSSVERQFIQEDFVSAAYGSQSEVETESVQNKSRMVLDMNTEWSKTLVYDESICFKTPGDQLFEGSSEKLSEVRHDPGSILLCGQSLKSNAPIQKIEDVTIGKRTEDVLPTYITSSDSTEQKTGNTSYTVSRNGETHSISEELSDMSNDSLNLSSEPRQKIVTSLESTTQQLNDTSKVPAFHDNIVTLKAMDSQQDLPQWQTETITLDNENDNFKKHSEEGQRATSVAVCNSRSHSPWVLIQKANLGDITEEKENNDAHFSLAEHEVSDTFSFVTDCDAVQLPGLHVAENTIVKTNVNNPAHVQGNVTHPESERFGPSHLIIFENEHSCDFVVSKNSGDSRHVEGKDTVRQDNSIIKVQDHDCSGNQVQCLENYRMLLPDIPEETDEQSTDSSLDKSVISHQYFDTLSERENLTSFMKNEQMTGSENDEKLGHKCKDGNHLKDYPEDTFGKHSLSPVPGHEALTPLDNNHNEKLTSVHQLIQRNESFTEEMPDHSSDTNIQKLPSVMDADSPESNLPSDVARADISPTGSHTVPEYVNRYTSLGDNKFFVASISKDVLHENITSQYNKEKVLQDDTLMGSRTDSYAAETKPCSQKCSEGHCKSTEQSVSTNQRSIVDDDSGSAYIEDKVKENDSITVTSENDLNKFPDQFPSDVKHFADVDVKWPEAVDISDYERDLDDSNKKRNATAVSRESNIFKEIRAEAGSHTEQLAIGVQFFSGTDYLTTVNIDASTDLAENMLQMKQEEDTSVTGRSKSNIFKQVTESELRSPSGWHRSGDADTFSDVPIDHTVVAIGNSEGDLTTVIGCYKGGNPLAEKKFDEVDFLETDTSRDLQRIMNEKDSDNETAEIGRDEGNYTRQVQSPTSVVTEREEENNIKQIDGINNIFPISLSDVSGPYTGSIDEDYQESIQEVMSDVTAAPKEKTGDMNQKERRVGDVFSAIDEGIHIVQVESKISLHSARFTAQNQRSIQTKFSETGTSSQNMGTVNKGHKEDNTLVHESGKTDETKQIEQSQILSSSLHFDSDGHKQCEAKVSVIADPVHCLGAVYKQYQDENDAVSEGVKGISDIIEDDTRVPSKQHFGDEERFCSRKSTVTTDSKIHQRTMNEKDQEGGIAVFSTSIDEGDQIELAGESWILPHPPHSIQDEEKLGDMIPVGTHHIRGQAEDEGTRCHKIIEKYEGVDTKQLAYPQVFSFSLHSSTYEQRLGEQHSPQNDFSRDLGTINQTDQKDGNAIMKRDKGDNIKNVFGPQIPVSRMDDWGISSSYPLASAEQRRHDIKNLGSTILQDHTQKMIDKGKQGDDAVAGRYERNCVDQEDESKTITTSIQLVANEQRFGEVRRLPDDTSRTHQATRNQDQEDSTAIMGRNEDGAIEQMAESQNLSSPIYHDIITVERVRGNDFIQIEHFESFSASLQQSPYAEEQEKMLLPAASTDYTRGVMLDTAPRYSKGTVNDKEQEGVTVPGGDKGHVSEQVDDTKICSPSTEFTSNGARKSPVTASARETLNGKDQDNGAVASKRYYAVVSRGTEISEKRVDGDSKQKNQSRVISTSLHSGPDVQRLGDQRSLLTDVSRDLTGTMYQNDQEEGTTIMKGDEGENIKEVFESQIATPSLNASSDMQRLGDIQSFLPYISRVHSQNITERDQKDDRKYIGREEEKTDSQVDESGMSSSCQISSDIKGHHVTDPSGNNCSTRNQEDQEGSTGIIGRIEDGAIELMAESHQLGIERIDKINALVSVLSTDYTDVFDKENQAEDSETSMKRVNESSLISSQLQLAPGELKSDEILSTIINAPRDHIEEVIKDDAENREGVESEILSPSFQLGLDGEKLAEIMPYAMNDSGDYMRTVHKKGKRVDTLVTGRYERDSKNRVAQTQIVSTSLQSSPVGDRLDDKRRTVCEAYQEVNIAAIDSYEGNGNWPVIETRIISASDQHSQGKQRQPAVKSGISAYSKEDTQTLPPKLQENAAVRRVDVSAIISPSLELTANRLRFGEMNSSISTGNRSLQRNKSLNEKHCEYGHKAGNTELQTEPQSLSPCSLQTYSDREGDVKADVTDFTKIKDGGTTVAEREQRDGFKQNAESETLSPSSQLSPDEEEMETPSVSADHIGRAIVDAAPRDFNGTVNFKENVDGVTVLRGDKGHGIKQADEAEKFSFTIDFPADNQRFGARKLLVDAASKDHLGTVNEMDQEYCVEWQNVQDFKGKVIERTDTTKQNDHPQVISASSHSTQDVQRLGDKKSLRTAVSRDPPGYVNQNNNENGISIMERDGSIMEVSGTQISTSSLIPSLDVQIVNDIEASLTYFTTDQTETMNERDKDNDRRNVGRGNENRNRQTDESAILSLYPLASDIQGHHEIKSTGNAIHIDNTLAMADKDKQGDSAITGRYGGNCVEQVDESETVPPSILLVAKDVKFGDTMPLVTDPGNQQGTRNQEDQESSTGIIRRNEGVVIELMAESHSLSPSSHQRNIKRIDDINAFVSNLTTHYTCATDGENHEKDCETLTDTHASPNVQRLTVALSEIVSASLHTSPCNNLSNITGTINEEQLEDGNAALGSDVGNRSKRVDKSGITPDPSLLSPGRQTHPDVKAHTSADSADVARTANDKYQEDDAETKVDEFEIVPPSQDLDANKQRFDERKLPVSTAYRDLIGSGSMRKKYLRDGDERGSIDLVEGPEISSTSQYLNINAQVTDKRDGVNRVIARFDEDDHKEKPHYSSVYDTDEKGSSAVCGSDEDVFRFSQISLIETNVAANDQITANVHEHNNTSIEEKENPIRKVPPFVGSHPMAVGGKNLKNSTPGQVLSADQTSLLKNKAQTDDGPFDEGKEKDDVAARDAAMESPQRQLSSNVEQFSSIAANVIIGSDDILCKMSPMYPSTEDNYLPKSSIKYATPMAVSASQLHSKVSRADANSYISNQDENQMTNVSTSWIHGPLVGHSISSLLPESWTDARMDSAPNILENQKDITSVGESSLNEYEWNPEGSSYILGLSEPAQVEKSRYSDMKDEGGVKEINDISHGQLNTTDVKEMETLTKPLQQELPFSRSFVINQQLKRSSQENQDDTNNLVIFSDKTQQRHSEEQSNIRKKQSLPFPNTSTENLDDVYLSWEDQTSEESTTTSDYKTPQQSPRFVLDLDSDDVIHLAITKESDSQLNLSSKVLANIMEETTSITVPNTIEAKIEAGENIIVHDLVSNADRIENAYERKALRSEVQDQIKKVKEQSRYLSDSAMGSDLTYNGPDSPTSSQITETCIQPVIVGMGSNQEERISEKDRFVIDEACLEDIGTVNDPDDNGHSTNVSVLFSSDLREDRNQMLSDSTASSRKCIHRSDGMISNQVTVSDNNKELHKSCSLLLANSQSHVSEHSGLLEVSPQDPLVEESLPLGGANADNRTDSERSSSSSSSSSSDNSILFLFPKSDNEELQTWDSPEEAPSCDRKEVKYHQEINQVRTVPQFTSPQVDHESLFTDNGRTTLNKDNADVVFPSGLQTNKDSSMTIVFADMSSATEQFCTAEQIGDTNKLSSADCKTMATKDSVSALATFEEIELKTDEHPVQCLVIGDSMPACRLQDSTEQRKFSSPELREILLKPRLAESDKFITTKSLDPKVSEDVKSDITEALYVKIRDKETSVTLVKSEIPFPEQTSEMLQLLEQPEHQDYQSAVGGSFQNSKDGEGRKLTIDDKQNSFNTTEDHAVHHIKNVRSSEQNRNDSVGLLEKLPLPEYKGHGLKEYGTQTDIDSGRRYLHPVDIMLISKSSQTESSDEEYLNRIMEDSGLGSSATSLSVASISSSSFANVSTQNDTLFSKRWTAQRFETQDPDDDNPKTSVSRRSSTEKSAIFLRRDFDSNHQGLCKKFHVSVQTVCFDEEIETDSQSRTSIEKNDPRIQNEKESNMQQLGSFDISGSDDKEDKSWSKSFSNVCSDDHKSTFTQETVDSVSVIPEEHCIFDEMSADASVFVNFSSQVHASAQTDSELFIEELQLENTSPELQHDDKCVSVDFSDSVSISVQTDFDSEEDNNSVFMLKGEKQQPTIRLFIAEDIPIAEESKYSHDVSVGTESLLDTDAEVQTGSDSQFNLQLVTNKITRSVQVNIDHLPLFVNIGSQTEFHLLAVDDHGQSEHDILSESEIFTPSFELNSPYVNEKNLDDTLQYSETYDTHVAQNETDIRADSCLPPVLLELGPEIGELHEEHSLMIKLSERSREKPAMRYHKPAFKLSPVSSSSKSLLPVTVIEQGSYSNGSPPDSHRDWLFQHMNDYPNLEQKKGEYAKLTSNTASHSKEGRPVKKSEMDTSDDLSENSQFFFSDNYEFNFNRDKVLRGISHVQSGSHGDSAEVMMHSQQMCSGEMNPGNTQTDHESNCQILVSQQTQQLSGITDACRPVHTAGNDDLVEDVLSDSNTPSVATLYVSDNVHTYGSGNMNAKKYVNRGVEASVDNSYEFTQTDHEDSVFDSSFSSDRTFIKASVGVASTDMDRIQSELERLEKERVEIIELLSLNYLPTSLTVELLEAKMNYCIGQTDMLLASLEDSWEKECSGLAVNSAGQGKFSKEYLANYKMQFKQSKRDMEACLQTKQRQESGGRGRTKTRKRDLVNMRRRAQIEAFKIERLREQQMHQRRRSYSPLKTTMSLQTESELSSPTSQSSFDFTPKYMSLRQRRKHHIDLRKHIVAASEDELRQLRSRSVSPLSDYSFAESRYSLNSSRESSLSPERSFSSLPAHSRNSYSAPRLYNRGHTFMYSTNRPHSTGPNSHGYKPHFVDQPPSRYPTVAQILSSGVDPEQMIEETTTFRQLNQRQIIEAESSLQHLEARSRQLSMRMTSTQQLTPGSVVYREISPVSDRDTTNITQTAIDEEIRSMREEHSRSSGSPDLLDISSRYLSRSPSPSSPGSYSNYASYARDHLARSERRIQSILTSSALCSPHVSPRAWYHAARGDSPSPSPSVVSDIHGSSESLSESSSTSYMSFASNILHGNENRYSRSRPISSADVKARIQKRSIRRKD